MRTYSVQTPRRLFLALARARSRALASLHESGSWRLGITRRWAKRGTRPSAPHDQRTASTYIFGAVCPKAGKGAALVLPACNIEAMTLHLAEIGKTIEPGAHAVLLVDQAGWHMSTQLIVPPSITIIPLPPK